MSSLQMCHVLDPVSQSLIFYNSFKRVGGKSISRQVLGLIWLWFGFQGTLKVHNTTWPHSWNSWISQMLILTFMIIYLTVDIPKQWISFWFMLFRWLFRITTWFFLDFSCSGHFLYGYFMKIACQRHGPFMNITYGYHFKKFVLKSSCVLMSLNY